MLIAKRENQIPISSLNLRNYINRLSPEIGIGLLKPFALNFYLTARVVNFEITEQRLIETDTEIAEISRAGSRAEIAGLIKIRVIA